MRPILPLAAAVLLVAPPAAEAGRHTGRTAGGYDISFALKGRKVSKLEATVPTSCVSTLNSPARAGGELYQPPGSVLLGGGAHRVKAEQEPAMHYDEVVKHYRTTVKRRGRHIVGSLHVNFSFNTVKVDSWGTHLEGWVCRGDDTFKVR